MGVWTGFQELLQKSLVHTGTNDIQKGKKEILEAKLGLWEKEAEDNECSLKTLPVTLCRIGKRGKKDKV